MSDDEQRRAAEHGLPNLRQDLKVVGAENASAIMLMRLRHNDTGSATRSMRQLHTVNEVGEAEIVVPTLDNTSPAVDDAGPPTYIVFGEPKGKGARKQGFGLWEGADGGLVGYRLDASKGGFFYEYRAAGCKSLVRYFVHFAMAFKPDGPVTQPLPVPLVEFEPPDGPCVLTLGNVYGSVTFDDPFDVAAALAHAAKVSKYDWTKVARASRPTILRSTTKSTLVRSSHCQAATSTARPPASSTGC